MTGSTNNDYRIFIKDFEKFRAQKISPITSSDHVNTYFEILNPQNN